MTKKFSIAVDAMGGDNAPELSKNNCKISHSPDKVPGDVSVRDAIKLGKQTSMWMAIESVKDGKNDIIVSSGNTGALLVMSKLILKMIAGVDKPALAAIWPNFKDYSIVLDLGANIECTENNLVEFSVLGSELYKTIFNKTNIVTGLLNIGSEEIKGNDPIKNAHLKLQKNKKWRRSSNSNGWIYWKCSFKNCRRNGKFYHYRNKKIFFKFNSVKDWIFI